MERSENASALRDWLGRQLRRQLRSQPIPDQIWRDLEGGGFVARASEGGDEERQALLEESKRRLRLTPKAQGGKGRTRRPRARPREVRYSAYEAARAEAMSRYLAHEASANMDVQSFRTTYLGRGAPLLSLPEAVAVLTSPAPRYMTSNEFAKARIPPVGHKASIVGEYHGPLSQLEPHRADSSSLIWRNRYTIRLEAGDRVHEQDCDQDVPRGTPPSSLEVPFYLSADGQNWIRIPVWKESVFADWKEYVDRIVRNYPWNEWDAVWFLLTGETPIVTPLRLEPPDWRIGSWIHLRVRLSIEPWLSAKSLMRFYRQMQRDLLAERIRPIKPVTLALLEFVISRVQPNQEVPSWGALMKEWNRVRPTHKYKSAWRFSRDYMRVLRAVTLPSYRLVQPKPEGETPAKA